MVLVAGRGKGGGWLVCSDGGGGVVSTFVLGWPAAATTSMCCPGWSADSRSVPSSVPSSVMIS